MYKTSSVIVETHIRTWRKSLSVFVTKNKVRCAHACWCMERGILFLPWVKNFIISLPISWFFHCLHKNRKIKVYSGLNSFLMRLLTWWGRTFPKLIYYFKLHWILGHQTTAGILQTTGAVVASGPSSKENWRCLDYEEKKVNWEVYLG